MYSKGETFFTLVIASQEKGWFSVWLGLKYEEILNVFVAYLK